MQCVKCGKDTHVLQTRETRRRRECLSCGHRFTTVETLLIGACNTGQRDTLKKDKPRFQKAPPTISKAKEKAIARKAARDRIEERKWDKEYEWDYQEDNNFLPDRW